MISVPFVPTNALHILRTTDTFAPSSPQPNVETWTTLKIHLLYHIPTNCLLQNTTHHIMNTSRRYSNNIRHWHVVLLAV